MSDFRLYNTLTRSIETFEPEDGKTVRVYTCGPTVYKPAHLGNFRTFLFEDLLRRVIGLRGWKVNQVMNLTDVDDKIIKAASEQGVTIGEVTAPVERKFNEDRAFLRIQDAELYPKATDHIPEMIAIVGRLMERKLAYLADDGTVYFAIDKFKGYGKLSRLDTREVKSGARVLQDDYSKENAQDFALWKAAKPEDETTGAAWDSPWGRGRPGWHLECSAMAMKYLGETLDIHCGGIDLIFPHLEDEIAQSEGATGKPFSRFWCHGEFLLTDGSKMAKRLGNVATVQDLREQGIPAAAFRHFVFSTHYRKQLNMSADALEASMEGVKRIADFAQRLADAKSATPELEKVAEDAESAVVAALYDDLNAPIAMGALFTFIRKANVELDRGGVDRRALEKAREVFARINSVLDVIPEATGPEPELASWIEERLAARKNARARKEFAQADAIRTEIEARGIAIEDGPQATKWKKLR
ncbi:MAG: cysteine--tRNA ligase [Gemmatimonadaceae bacterium]